MIVVGITGGIAMGKSTAARIFQYYRVPVFDADAAVRLLLQPGSPIYHQLTTVFPNAVTDAGLDRTLLRGEVFRDRHRLKQLEDITHPQVFASARRFLRRCRYAHTRMVVLDIPLLFEVHHALPLDVVVAVSAPASVQRQRLRRRNGMTDQIISSILDRQMPDRERRRRADVVILNGLSRHYVSQSLKSIFLGRSSCEQLSSIRKRRGSIRRRATG